MRRAGRSVVLAIALVLCAAVPAQAATTVGSSLRQRANLYVRCSGTCTATQTARPGGTGITIPADGVISRWRIRAATLGQVRLRVLRSQSGGGYTAVAAADPVRLDRSHAPGQDVLYEFPVRISVHEGDAIALDRDAKAGGIFHYYGDSNTSYATAEFAPALKDDAVDVMPTSTSPGRELLVNVDVEKDADGDGFGDESQDNCPTIANDQTDKPCSTPTPSTQTPEGPTSTPIDSNPGARNQGSAGPPLEGERKVAREKRRHTTRKRARRAPVRPRDPQRQHSGVRRRARPPRPSGDDVGAHRTDPNPRPKPVARQRPSETHEPASPRPKPPTPRAPAGEEHGGTTHRTAPRPKGQSPARRHSRKPRRAAPHPRPAPGWQHHSG